MYQPRTVSDMTTLANRLATHGILAVDDIYSVVELSRLNAIMNPIFASKASDSRSYIRPDEMMDAGILENVLTRKMKDLIFSIVPDAVLYHLHAYEISGNATKSHIFAEQPGGWHRDPDSVLYQDDPTHVSIFVYLTDVGESDGPFEFCPRDPNIALSSDNPSISMIGSAGFSFVWHRSYYHRAAPNRADQRRRLIKISIQPNSFHSTHLRNDFFRRVADGFRIGDEEMDVLFGRYQGRKAPKIRPVKEPRVFVLQPNRMMSISGTEFQLMGEREKASYGSPVAYD